MTALEPDLIVVSGDFTQRAKIVEFEQARDFLATLPGEKLTVPGNHDIPLWNVCARLFTPLRNYTRFISRDLSPIYRDAEMVVLGINTARSLTWKDGRINREQAAEARARLSEIGAGVIKIIVTHHPFDDGDLKHEDELVGRGGMAMKEFAACGADLLLAGHFHTSYTGGTARRYKIAGHSALVVQAGTATSTRLRGHANSFNVLRIDPPRVEVEILTWLPDRSEFETTETKRYERIPGTGFTRI